MIRLCAQPAIFPAVRFTPTRKGPKEAFFASFSWFFAVESSHSDRPTPGNIGKQGILDPYRVHTLRAGQKWGRLAIRQAAYLAFLYSHYKRLPAPVGPGTMYPWSPAERRIDHYGPASNRCSPFLPLFRRPARRAGRRKSGKNGETGCARRVLVANPALRRGKPSGGVHSLSPSQVKFHRELPLIPSRKMVSSIYANSSWQK